MSSRDGGGDHSFGYSAPVGQWVHLTFAGTDSETALWVNGLPGFIENAFSAEEEADEQARGGAFRPGGG